MSVPSGGADFSVERREAEISILRAKGEIDLAGADEFEGAFRSAADAAAAMVLDLREVEFLDSSGLRVLLLAAADLGPRLAVLIVPDSPVARVIDLAEVSERLAVHSDEEAALAAIATGSAGDGA
jgi:anti-sigma B factor antagonist